MKRSRRAGTDDSTKTADRPPLVLLVDDFQDNREMYAMYLEHAGLQVAEAGNGHEALDQAFRLLPDLIVMDLSLPGIDGWEATRRLKADERAAGCDAFVTKPCLPEQLLSEIRKVLAAP